MAGWAAVLVSHGQLPDSGCRSSSLHQKQRHSIEGRTSPCPTHPQDTFSRLSAPQYRPAVTPPCRSPGMPRGRTSTAAAQANGVMRRHPDCSEGRSRLVARSPHGHEQHARTTDATGREPRVPQSYGRYLVALYNGVRTHLALDKDSPLHRPAQTVGRIASVTWLGGLHRHYVRMASSVGTGVLQQAQLSGAKRQYLSLGLHKKRTLCQGQGFVEVTG